MTPHFPSYRTITLTQGQVALVDAEDYARISKHKWQARWDSDGQHFYAVRSFRRDDGKKSVTSMHREILGLKHGDKRQGDHKNKSETLDNRRENLRIVSHSEQQCNRGKPRNNSSGFKGVYRHQGRFEARIQVNKKRVHLGGSETPEGAYALYCEAAQRLHGEFASVI